MSDPSYPQTDPQMDPIAPRSELRLDVGAALVRLVHTDTAMVVGLELKEGRVDTKAASKAYHKAEEALNDVLSEAMCELYKDMTGKPAGDRLRDALYDAVRFNN